MMDTVQMHSGCCDPPEMRCRGHPQYWPGFFGCQANAMSWRHLSISVCYCHSRLHLFFFSIRFLSGHILYSGDMKPQAGASQPSVWDAIDDIITHLIEESAKHVQPISEPENVIKSKINTLRLAPNTSNLFNFCFFQVTYTLAPHCMTQVAEVEPRSQLKQAVDRAEGQTREVMSQEVLITSCTTGVVYCETR
jgi:hypothetical protein